MASLLPFMIFSDRFGSALSKHSGKVALGDIAMFASTVVPFFKRGPIDSVFTVNQKT